DDGYSRAEKLLSDNIDKLHEVAEALLEREKLDYKEFEEIFEKTDDADEDKREED
ncbi:MAG: hypothetical protein GX974_09960, partial [Clostridiales bacterium]|nr:hypothetical protein [Clostridiales bacterium]